MLASAIAASQSSYQVALVDFPVSPMESWHVLSAFPAERHCQSSARVVLLSFMLAEERAGSNGWNDIYRFCGQRAH